MGIRPGFLLPTIAIVGLLLPGCAGVPMLGRLAEEKVETDSASNPITDIVCLWEPAEGHAPDGKPARGFAGQVMFMTRSGAAPVKIGGEVAVYEFDDHGTLDEQSKPLHVFRFDNYAWTAHLRDGTLGPTYSVFIPYMRKHHYEAKCAVRLKYTSADGRVAYSSMANVTLPGPKPKKQRSAIQQASFDSGGDRADTPGGVRHADFVTDDRSSTGRRGNRLKSTTIRPGAGRSLVVHADAVGDRDGAWDDRLDQQAADEILRERGLLDEDGSLDAASTRSRMRGDVVARSRRTASRPRQLGSLVRRSLAERTEPRAQYNAGASVSANSATPLSVDTDTF